MPPFLLLKPLGKVASMFLRDVHGRYLLVILALTVALLYSRSQVAAYREALAARPKIDLESEIESLRHEKRGKVREVVKYQIVPGSCEPVIVEKVIERDPVDITTEKKSEIERKESSACVAPRPRWYVGGGYAAGYVPNEAWAGRIGLTNGWLDVGYRYGRADRSHGVEAAIRF